MLTFIFAVLLVVGAALVDGYLAREYLEARSRTNNSTRTDMSNDLLIETVMLVLLGVALTGTFVMIWGLVEVLGRGA